MTTRTGNPPQDAVQAPSETAIGAPEDAARQGVPCACGSDAQRGDGRYPVAWLHITAPPDWQAMPTATSKCFCGSTRTHQTTVSTKEEKNAA
ncbi:hypothetical protein [Streptomyces yatensis]|uniref:Uncharacterized protein n=1 Tax=Streptomyces yatensis TaxID=155177 RepID=A0ABN2IRN8_9ACTN|nr:hypothetical protein [Streptomyces yatensis]